MKKIDNEKLYEIFNNLKHGISYGKDCENCKYPYFHTVLSIDWQGKYIHYSHYGSSATKVTIPELLWIIEIIFEMSPTEFLNEYIPINESKYKEV